MPQFYLQIVNAEGEPLTSPFRPLKRRHGSLDIPLIEACEEKIMAKGVGLFKTEAQVRQAIREGMADAIQSLKDDYLPLVKPR